MIIRTVGSDPEFFVLDKNGKPYPATPFAEGDKENPRPILELGKGFFEQRDNLSFEGNIPPSLSKENFINNITSLRNYFSSKVGKYGYSLSPNGVERFPKRMLNTKEGMEFGCSSVISIWDSNINNIVSLPTPSLKSVNYRVSGFHIHLGLQDCYPMGLSFYSIIVARLFDLFLTLPSHKIKDEPERLLSYGKYGMVRLKNYGVECRTLSTFFTQKEYLPWVWDQIKKIEQFISLISKEDLPKLNQKAHLVSKSIDLENAFSDIFSTFKNKECLSKFDETKNIKIYERNNDKENSNHSGSHSDVNSNIPFNSYACTTNYYDGQCASNKTTVDF
jgi:hypothetical protein